MKRKIPLILLCIGFLGIAGYFGIRLCQEWSEYRAGEKAYASLAQYVYLDPSPAREEIPKAQTPVPSDPTDTAQREQACDTSPADTAQQEPAAEPDDTNWPTVDFEALQAINPDIVAWIFIEGTNINYPVVQSADNSYYLSRLFDGSYNSAGTVFMDYRNESDLSDRHTVFYGHYMQNGTMFYQITNYKAQAFFDAHPVCLVMTPSGNYKLEFFAGYVTDLNSQAWKLEFATDEEYTLWLEDAKARSTFTSATSPTAQDRVVTFSTCIYDFDDARYVLAGVLKHKPS